MTDTTDNTTSEGADVADHHPADERLIAREEAAFARAAEADQRIKGGLHFLDWLAIGEGLAAMRDRALRESYSNRPYGKAYTQRYKALKEAHPWAGHYDPGTISHACWLHDNLTDVLRWRDRLSANQREAWTTPRVVHQHYDRMTKVDQAKAADLAPKLSPQARDKQAMVEAIEKADRLERENERLKAQDNAGSLFDLKSEPAPQIASVIVNTVSDYKASEIHKALGAAIKAKRAKTKAPAG